MEDAVKFEDFPSICRICFCRSDLRPFPLTLQELFTSLTKIVSQDELPKNVCSTCVEKLEKIQNFINECLINNEHLEDVLMKHRNGFSMKYFKEDPKFEILEDNESVSEQDEDKKEICHLIDTSNGSEYQCGICNKIFRNVGHLKRHFASHSKETPYECQYCFVKFKFPQNVTRHIKIVHKGIKPFKCDLCGRDFGQYATLKDHILTKHYIKVSNCQYGSDEYHKLVTIENMNQQKQKKESEPKEKKTALPVKCSICNETFENLYRLKNHRLLEHSENAYIYCEICGKNFLRKPNLISHMRVHTGEKPFECEVCGKQFPHDAGRRRHILLHTGERPYKCDFCEKTFKQAAHLKHHIRGHMNEKPFQCSFCPKRFNFKKNMEVHQRIHTGEKPYRCEICYKRFNDLGSVGKHRKKFHTEAITNSDDIKIEMIESF